MKPFFPSLRLGVACSLFVLAIPATSFATIKSEPPVISEAPLRQNPKLTLVIVDAETKKKITAKVRVLDMANKKVLFSNTLSDTLKMNLVAGGDYRVVSKADSHLFN